MDRENRSSCWGVSGEKLKNGVVPSIREELIRCGVGASWGQRWGGNGLRASQKKGGTPLGKYDGRGGTDGARRGKGSRAKKKKFSP